MEQLRDIKLDLVKNIHNKKAKEIFSQFVRFTSICLILVIAHIDLELNQMDDMTIFLNEELDEKIYMLQQVRFEDACHTGRKLVIATACL